MSITSKKLLNVLMNHRTILCWLIWITMIAVKLRIDYLKNSRKMFQYEKSNLISKQSGISLHVIVTHVKVALRCGTKRKNAVECYNCVCVSHHNIMMHRYKGRDVSIDWGYEYVLFISVKFIVILAEKVYWFLNNI